ncbi:hypothetical protein K7X08_020709 [Anisodus acutangulus]|uniref:Protein kinase domain-containing protein n=1 Tax=Anisodus acutangulus TaxID=402998 RepID=A0A9Q1RQ87_9SOLA|nr:hypothetical protein K7X08_020709 [Anisodus acutangulus]
MEAENDDYQKKERATAVTILVFASLSIASLFVAFSYYCYIRNQVAKRFKNRTYTESSCEDKGNSFANLKVIAEKGFQVFTFKQLQSATGGFEKSNVIGHGAFGSVYRGVLQDGRKVAIKMMDQAGKQGEEEFKVEVELLCRLRSPYLLSLIGYCSETSHKLLVYEFTANGGLQEHLYPLKGMLLKVWNISMNMSIPQLYRDLKSSNILLDKNFHAKVSDFGLAKLGSDKAGGHVSTRVLGTQGYVAPEYALTGHLTTKSDVYSYGVPVDIKRSPGEGVLVSWALPRLTDREKVVEIMDPALKGQYSMKEVIQVAAIAAMCVQPEADYRPLMADVVQSLVPLVKQPRPTAKAGSCSSFHATQPPPPNATQSPKA